MYARVCGHLRLYCVEKKLDFYPMISATCVAISNSALTIFEGLFLTELAKFNTVKKEDVFNIHGI